MAPATSAGPEIIHREHYEGTDHDSYSHCGFVVEVDVTFSGRVLIREGTHRTDSAYFVHDSFQYTETQSANGKFFTISGNALFHETRAVPLGGNLFEFHAIEAGQPFVVRDMEGDVLLRDRGVIRRTVVFDTEGDEEPGGIFIGPMEACPLLAPEPT